MRGVAASLLAAASLLSTAVAQIDPIVIKGNKFFHTNSGEQFYMKGVAYQQGVGQAGTSTTDGQSDSPDPLADADGCKRDVPLLEELGTNIIRVYAVDPDSDHKACMDLLADAGIFVIADLSEPNVSINRDDPGWTDELFTRYAKVVDELQQYDNFFGGFAGNEVSNMKNNTDASAFVKAAVRDMKAYIKTKGYREGIGIGYATNDDADIRENMAHYFNCGPDEESVDFYGYNIYSWCGESTFQESGYDVRTKEFETYNKPVFFAEYGCNEQQGAREFLDTPVLYGPQMSDVWSGGIVYMYFQEENNYGLVELSGNSVEKLPDFDNLKSQIEKADPQGTTLDQFQPTNTEAQQCPDVNDEWEAAASPLPPTANPELCSCMVKSLTCIVKPSVDEKAYKDIFDYACENGGPDTCTGTQKDGQKGEYGAYSMCNAEEQLSWVLTQYQKSQGGAADACDFDGQATTQSPSESEGSCSDLLDQAGPDGTGTVNSQPGGPGDDEASKDAGASLQMLSFSAYVIMAVLGGSGLMLL